MSQSECHDRFYPARCDGDDRQEMRVLIFQQREYTLSTALNLVICYP